MNELNSEQAVATTAPVAETNRIKTIDMLRGVALLGILLMNIPTFSMADYSSEVYRNDPSSGNFWLNAFISVVFEGKMRALFGMVFGAGVLLFTMKKESLGKPVHALFYSRMFWLVVFGLMHAHLLAWWGDILYVYGICGMVVYLFRNVPPKYLVLGVPLVAIWGFVSGTRFYQDLRIKRIAYVEATKAKADNKTLTDTQTKALTEWRQIELTMIPNREDAQKNTQTMKSDYKTVATYMRTLAWETETKFLLLDMWDSLALMFLGLALFKWGFLTGNWSRKDYWKVVWIGYGIGLPLVIYSFYYGFINFPNLEANLARMERVSINWVNLIYPFQRILLVMAHVAALILLYKSNIAQSLFKRLGAVGQMAFTNYISHTVICTLFFYGYGLNYFGVLEFYQIYFLVAIIWLFQLILSPIWLKYYYFGPLEWLWRSLTYWQLQPMRRRA
jgi:uncharacterized protein